MLSASGGRGRVASVDLSRWGMANREEGVFVAESVIDASAEEVFAYFERDGALRRLTPPYEEMQVVSREGGIGDGARVELRMKVGPFRRRWVAEHRGYVPGRQFVDVQTEGPFARWEHTHRFEPLEANRCRVVDQIHYALPLGGLGRALGEGAVRRRLERVFTYRHAVLAHDMRLHRLAERPLRVAMTGASGFLGRNLRALLESGGHEVVPLVRGQGRRGIEWDPEQGRIDRAALEGFDVVYHLAGEPIAQRWTPAAKERIRRSRREGTRLLATTLAELARPPSVLVSMSGVNYYGVSDEAADESSPAGTGFLAEVCIGWEEASSHAKAAGTRVVNPRMGVVLSPEDGALAKMLPAFSAGLGGRIGSGRQEFSWVSVDDAIGALYFCALHRELEGPVNVTAPEPISNARFVEALGEVLGRPVVMPLPAFAIRAALGEMGEEALLGGVRAFPRRLEKAGYPFAQPRIEDALRHLLGRPASSTRLSSTSPSFSTGRP